MNSSEAFSESGPLSEYISDYILRPGQVAMAAAIERVLESGGNLVAEAGTGIGKTYAYIVPLLLDAGKRRTVIATGTINLQRQLCDRDFPVMKKALGSDASVSVLYGRGNYICLRKAGERRSFLSDRIVDWIEKSETGAIPDMPPGIKTPDIFSDRNDCLGQRNCPHASECFYYRARERAFSSDIIVTNYRLLFIDANARRVSGENFDTDAVLPAYDTLVLDEAHKISDEATAALSSVFSSDSLTRLLSYIVRAESRFEGRSLLDALEREEKIPGIGGLIKEGVSVLKSLARDFESILARIFIESGILDGDILLTEQMMVDYSSSFEKLSDIAKEIENLSLMIRTGYMYENDSLRPEKDSLFSIAQSLSELSNVLCSFTAFDNPTEEIPLMRKSGDSYSISISPMRTGPLIAEILLDKIRTKIFTSATLSVDGDFSYFFSISGLKTESTEFITIKSPFDYARNLEILIPEDGAVFDFSNSDDYEEYLSETIEKCVGASSGSALVLFTSKNTMKGVVKRVGGRIDNLLVQGEKASSLLDEFRNNGSSSLFALSSFWEGVDAPGDSLKLVIITKLPFTNVNDPIARVRSANMDDDGGSGFIRMDLPLAIIKLRQGVGRLIRTETDRGVVVILDSRILRKGYGKKVLRSLPGGYFPENVRVSNLAEHIERFLY